MAAKKRSIYRKEVFDALTARHGDVLLTRPTSFSVISLFLVVVAGLLLTYAIVTQFTQTRDLPGAMVIEQGEVKARALEASLVEQVLVQEGQQVTQGQPLLKVTVPSRRYDSDSLAKMQSAIEEKIDSAERRLGFQRRLNQLQADALANEEQTLIEQQRQLQAQIQLEQEFLEHLTSMAKQAKTGEQGQYDRLYTQVLEKRIHIHGLNQDSQQLTLKIGSIEQRLQSAVIKGEEMLTGYRQQLGQLQLDLAKLTGDQSYMITAPRGGVVARLGVTKGQFLQSGDAAVTLMPEAAKLVAELKVRSDLVRHIEAEQPVWLKIDAFPYQRFGLFEGKVTKVSHSVVEPEAFANAQGPQVPMYRAIVELHQPQDSKLGPITLQSGMSLQAMVKGGTQSIWSWMVAPQTEQ
ncbi:HlyD family secretion protein [Ferrimonas aestuarii]|uniref:HlyD family efflux transporter periplasmic adaptor subunit n=1 Tax=Ferrimonas aestuarii TaxID=2569539 RepID=A0A4U1BP83_9GAMM|nr:HlyD family efflux transporter periplasmic adaptor subunit [Ferrimonas aestuarii]TKB55332.1 HlyD family efflux transporter periplasmic adaptor subunit [Ferrimonas aestuarii]